MNDRQKQVIINHSVDSPSFIFPPNLAKVSWFMLQAISHLQYNRQIYYNILFFYKYISSYHIVSYHIVSYHIVLYCIKSYHIILYHMTVMYRISSNIGLKHLSNNVTPRLIQRCLFGSWNGGKCGQLLRSSEVILSTWFTSFNLPLHLTTSVYFILIIRHVPRYKQKDNVLSKRMEKQFYDVFKVGL